MKSFFFFIFYTFHSFFKCEVNTKNWFSIIIVKCQIPHFVHGFFFLFFFFKISSSVQLQEWHFLYIADIKKKIANLKSKKQQLKIYLHVNCLFKTRFFINQYHKQKPAKLKTLNYGIQLTGSQMTQQCSNILVVYAKNVQDLHLFQRFHLTCLYLRSCFFFYNAQVF